MALPGGPRFDGRRWTDQIGPAHESAVVRETIRALLDEAAAQTNDLNDAARLRTAARLDAVLRVVKSFPALTIETADSAGGGREGSLSIFSADSGALPFGRRQGWLINRVLGWKSNIAPVEFLAPEAPNWPAFNGRVAGFQSSITAS
jgi:hypothetical protein